MLSEKMEKALNDQMNAEFYSAYLYMAMSAYFQSLNLKGFSSWMSAQVQEEMIHMNKFQDFINERGGRVRFSAVDEPPFEWASPIAVFDATLEHEQKVTGLINALVELAAEEHDHASSIFLQWFVTEQVEEEDSVNDVIQRLRLMGDAPGGLFMLDAELGKRAMPVSGQPESE
jgi:ferritin